MNLTDSNYYSDEANKAYMSWSQFKAWVECPAGAHARFHAGTWSPKPKAAFVEGNYFHTAMLEPDKLAGYKLAFAREVCGVERKKATPRADWKFKKRTKAQAAEGMAEDDVSLVYANVQTEDEPVAEWAQRVADAPVYSAYQRIDHCVRRMQQQEYIMEYLAISTGIEQAFTFTLGGMEWKCKLDVIGDGYILDLKCMKDFEDVWSDTRRRKVPFWLPYGYHRQLTVYRHGARQNGCPVETLLIAGITKQPTPAVALWEFPPDQFLVDDHGTISAEFEQWLTEIHLYKDGVETPWRCGTCEYCRITTHITEATPINIQEYDQ